MQRILLISALFLVSSFEAASQVKLEWRLMGPTTKPIARERHDMVYDARLGQTILFGGRNGSSYYNDTWVYDAKGWQLLQPAKSPEPRSDHTMAYDPVRERVVLIGGTDGKLFDDTWEWDGKAWTRIVTGVRGLGAGAASCYDPLLGGILFNLDSVNMVWNGKTWSHLLAQNGKGGTSHRIVYFAGSGGPLAQVSGQSLVFKKNAGWGRIGTTKTFNVQNYAMAVDPKNRRAILHGGDGSVGRWSGSGDNHTWMWSGSAWSEVAPKYWQGRSRHAMTFDLARGVFVMFGGRQNNGAISNETWELHEVGPRASYRTFGKGCAGTSTYQPSLAPDPILNSAPVVGGAFTLRGDGLPPSQPVLLALGASDKKWAGLSLPFSLTPLGMPGCNVLVSLDIIQGGVRSNSSGRVWWTFPVPNDTRLLGVVFYNQAAVLAPGANAASLLWTNAGAGVIGAY